jgi:hypothetical protein
MYTILILKNGYFYDYHTFNDVFDVIFMFDESIRFYMPDLYSLIKECQKDINPNKLRRMMGPNSRPEVDALRGNEDKTLINDLFTNDDYIIECYTDMICISSSSTTEDEEKFSIFLLGIKSHYLQQMKEVFDTT